MNNSGFALIIIIFQNLVIYTIGESGVISATGQYRPHVFSNDPEGAAHMADIILTCGRYNPALPYLEKEYLCIRFRNF